MTERRSSGRRLDLRALDAADDPQRTEAVLSGVMAQLDANSRSLASLRMTEGALRTTPGALGASDGALRDLLFFRRVLIAAAAVLVVVAVSAVYGAPRSQGSSSDPIVTWAQSSHVPTNGELLAVYQGYRP